jgi:hypothetical protein
MDIFEVRLFKLFDTLHQRFPIICFDHIAQEPKSYNAVISKDEPDMIFDDHAIKLDQILSKLILQLRNIRIGQGCNFGVTV